MFLQSGNLKWGTVGRNPEILVLLQYFGQLRRSLTCHYEFALGLVCVLDETLPWASLLTDWSSVGGQKTSVNKKFTHWPLYQNSIMDHDFHTTLQQRKQKVNNNQHLYENKAAESTYKGSNILCSNILSNDSGYLLNSRNIMYRIDPC